MYTQLGRLRVLIVGLAAAGLVGCRAPGPPSARSAAVGCRALSPPAAQPALSETTPRACGPCAGRVSGGADGKIAFASTRTGNYEIFVTNGDGTGATNLTNDPATDYHPAWSPDGTRIAFTSHRNSGFGNIFAINADGTGLTQLTHDWPDDHEMGWSPDGTKIAFASKRAGNYEIFVMNADGTDVKQLTNDPSDDREPAWSPDGTKIAYSSGGVGGHGFDKRTGNYEIFVMNADGTGVTKLTNQRDDDQNPAWSPDGTMIAWRTDRSSKAGKVLVMNADGTGVKKLADNPATGGDPVIDGFRDWSPDGSPAWSPDGSKVAFSSRRAGNTEIVVIDADGCGVTDLTNHPALDDEPAWQPRPPASPVPTSPVPTSPVLPSLPPTL